MSVLGSVSEARAAVSRRLVRLIYACGGVLSRA